MPKKTTKPTRRSFVKTSAAVGAGFWAAGGVAPKRTYASRLDEIQYACIGIGGKGSSDSDDAKRTGKVVGVCDIDANTLEKGKAKFTEAKQFFDFREMLDQMGDKIDAVTVSTPDHTHAVAALYAMRMGKHCFCQKPLSHSIQEARMMGELAKEKNLVTQMGNQGTAGSILRKSAALLANGAIGDVKHVHVWTNRPVWPQGIDINVAEPSTPGHVHWDEWIGPAVSRPYSPEIHPFKWRGFWAFGTGALGDMACHTLNMAFMGLNLKNPTSVAAVTSGHDKVMYPKWSEIEFEFPENEGRPALGMTWYEGLGWSLMGTIVGLGLLLPAYAIGGMGAGDVKLLAGIGAWMHATHTAYAFVISAFVGALLAILMVWYRKAWAKHRNQFWLIYNEIMTVRDPNKLSQLAAERKSSMLLLPYGIPIAIGTIVYFAWMNMLV